MGLHLESGANIASNAWCGKKTYRNNNWRFEMNERGRECEQRVAEYLKEQGYEVRERNYRCREGEVDIIACKDEILCFVEVKSLSQRWLPQELSRMVDGQKRRRIQLTAIDYLNKVHSECRCVVMRFDVASVTGAEVTYYEGVF
jgi:putative endonuclease